MSVLLSSLCFALFDKAYPVIAFLLPSSFRIVHNDTNPFGRVNQADQARLLPNQLQPMLQPQLVPGMQADAGTGIMSPLHNNQLASRVNQLFQQHNVVNTQLSFITSALGALAGAVGVSLPQQPTTQNVQSSSYGMPPRAGLPAQGSFTIMPQAAQQQQHATQQQYRPPVAPLLQSPWGQASNLMPPPPTAESTGTPRMPCLEEAALVPMPVTNEQNNKQPPQGSENRAKQVCQKSHLSIAPFLLANINQ